MSLYLSLNTAKSDEKRFVHYCYTNISKLKLLIKPQFLLKYIYVTFLAGIAPGTASHNTIIPIFQQVFQVLLHFQCIS